MYIYYYKKEADDKLQFICNQLVMIIRLMVVIIGFTPSKLLG